MADEMTEDRFGSPDDYPQKFGSGKHLYLILPIWLYLGDLRAAKNKHLLTGLGITHILNVASDTVPAYHEGDFEYRCVPLVDVEKEDILSEFDDAIDFIVGAREAAGDAASVLVHCAGGISRSSSVIVAFLMREEGLTLMDAYALVKARKPDIQPNDGFMEQLIAFEVRIHGAASVSLERGKGKGKGKDRKGRKGKRR